MVFDGYMSGPTTKDMTHLRRGGTRGPLVNFTEDQIFTGKKANFLRNINNKDRFPKLLGNFLGNKNHQITHCESDADIGIVQKAIELSTNGQKVCVIGEDTDLLILLLHHSKTEHMYLLLPLNPQQRGCSASGQSAVSRRV